MWDDFWRWADTSPLGSNVVGGLIVALVVALAGLVASIVKKSWRNRVWGGIARLFRAIKKIKVTTVDYIETEYERGVEAGWAAHAQKVNEETAALARRIAARGPSETPKARIFPSIPAKPTKGKLPPPRWSVQSRSKSHPNSYVILNLDPKSIAKNIRLDAPTETFDFYDSARWEDLEDLGDYYREKFSGKVKGSGRNEGVMFTVTWEDENAHEQSAKVHLERPPRPPIVVG